MVVNLIATFRQIRQTGRQTQRHAMFRAGVPSRSRSSLSVVVQFLRMGDSFSTPPLIVTNVRINFLCLGFGRAARVLSPLHALLCGDIGHCFLFLLMAVVLFTIRQKQPRTFPVAADSPQIRLHIPESEIAQFYSETLHDACHGCPERRGSLALANPTV